MTDTSDASPSGRDQLGITRTDRWRLGFAVVAVVVATAAFRMPSCTESFWLDELHSAWAVSDSFANVAPRAALGNQTSGYFHLLWVWSAMVGTEESMLRLSSVLASCLAAACLVVGVGRRTGCICAGLIAGMILAVDPNGVFFGCELRPYAFVMCCAVLAVWSMMAWLDGAPANGSVAATHQGFTIWQSRGGARWRLVMLFWICVAALIHPTSLGVLLGLVPVAWLIAWRMDRLQLWRADWLAVILALITLLALAMSSLPNSWAHREWWKAFGQATKVSQLWYAWAWMPLLGWPAGAAILSAGLGKLTLWITGGKDSSQAVTRHRSVWLGIVPGAVAVFGTGLFFCLSFYDWIPLWHRRYYVAALPLLAWTAGELSAIVSCGLKRIGGSLLGTFFGVNGHPRTARWMDRGSGVLVALTMVAAALWHQGALRGVAEGRIPLQLRGESWREATALVRDNMRPGDWVWLDSQLIEASFLREPFANADPVSDAQWDYLRFPLDGPYRLENVVVVDCQEHRTWLKQHVGDVAAGPPRVWLISRSGQQAVTRFITLLQEFREVSVTKELIGRPFVLRLDFQQ